MISSSVLTPAFFKNVLIFFILPFYSLNFSSLPYYFFIANSINNFSHFSETYSAEIFLQ